MSLYVDPKQSIIDATNTANGTNLTLSDVVFAAPTVAPSDVVTTSGKNSQIRLTGNGTTWSGTVVVNYNRLNLSDIITLTSNTLHVGPVTSTWDIINYLNFYYGMILTTDDIQQDVITLDSNGAGTTTLTATSTSIGWQGSVTLNLVKGDDLIDYAVTDLSLSGINYPTNQSAKAQAPLVMYPYDFTSSKTLIAAFNAGDVFTSSLAGATSLVSAMNAAIGNASYNWDLVNGTGTNTLWNSKVVYNGLNSAEFASNQSYKYVMIVQVADGSGNNGVTAANNTGFVGLMYYHYNDPVQ